MNLPIDQLAVPILALPRAAKRFVALSVDLGLCVLTVWLAYYLRFGEFVALSGKASWAVTAAIGIALPIFFVSGLYRAIFRYSGWPALLAVARAIGVYGLLYVSIFTAIGVAGVPRTVGLIQPILLFLFVGTSRALARVWLGGPYLSILKQASRPRVMIYGAGHTGRQLAAAMRNSTEMQVTGFLDDDDRLHGHVLDGQRIYNPVDLVTLVTTLNIRTVLLAMPNLPRRRRTEILNQIRLARVAVRALPSAIDLAQEKVGISDLRELDIDDLLGRESMVPNHILLSRSIVGKVVLVTGAGGSIGSELCRQVLALSPAKLLLVEQNEFALNFIHQELEAKYSCRQVALVALLASVQDDERMREIMATWHPDTVYHAAAYKHVPMVEHNPAAGIKNNVLGTLRTALAASENGVKDFVLISTDQVVRPSHLMGASKRLAEMVLQSLAFSGTRTRFSMVRFGNVMDTAGSVVPRLRQQIRNGGPITLAHPDVTRYFMTILEAAQLVIQGGAMSKGGDVFVLDMGLPMKIMDLARSMVELSGLTVKDENNPEGDIAITFAGLLPGEALDEKPLTGDNPLPTLHPRIMKVHEEPIPWAELETMLNALEIALNVNDVSVIRLMMQQLVSGYTPSDEILDWVFLEQAAESERLGMAG